MNNPRRIHSRVLVFPIISFNSIKLALPEASLEELMARQSQSSISCLFKLYSPDSNIVGNDGKEKAGFQQLFIFG
jgi:hypothetical protein